MKKLSCLVMLMLLVGCATSAEKAARACATNSLQAFYEKEVAKTETVVVCK